MKKLLLLIIGIVIIQFVMAQSDRKDSARVNILTIGDSNGTFDYSWPKQLARLIPKSKIVNKSISGNTIGFDNLGRENLNTLKNINRYLDEAFNEIGSDKQFDFILINLGTNDTKVIFIENQKKVPENLGILFHLINQYLKQHQKSNTKICFITPAPMDETKINVEKYGGGDLRIQKNNKEFKKVAHKNHVDFVDTYTLLKEGFSDKTTDGVHLNEKAQIQMANQIAKYLLKKL
jgi:lysophospholipase L1-like esterase